MDEDNEMDKKNMETVETLLSFDTIFYYYYAAHGATIMTEKQITMRQAEIMKIIEVKKYEHYTNEYYGRLK